MEHTKRCLEIDPDYKISERALKRVKIKEDKEKQCTVEKIKEIINQEFEVEFECRQKQLELIQQNIIKAQKTLHLLRYVIITSYYNKQELLLNSTEDTSANEASLIDKQGRIHPAIKKLLGNNLTNVDLNYSTSRRKRTKQIKYLNNTVIQESEDNTLKRIESKRVVKKEGTVKEEPPSAEIKEETNYNFVRNRKKTKYRVVIGNISKWLPSEGPEDTFTHKWMVYVRGPKEAPDVSHFIQKVVFYLHPSYKPNDVVELRDSPFHLSRRGWGEFPLRVQIYFQCTLNKPIDVVHNLKLDKTYTGRQTLGNETIVDLFLYEDCIENDSKDVSSVSDEQCDEVKVEIPSPLDLDIKQEIEIDEIQLLDPNSYYEHNYCTNADQEDTENGVAELQQSTSLSGDYIFTEHDYCGNLENIANEESERSDDLNRDKAAGEPQAPQSSSDNVIEEAVVDDFTVNLKINRNPPQDRKFILSRLINSNGIEKIITDDGRVFMLKRKKPQLLMKKVFHRKPVAVEMKSGDEDCENFQVDVPGRRFKTMLEVLPFLFKRLPIITELADDATYKSMYPYSVGTLEKYSQWNIGKRMSAEWRRAKMILNMAKKAKIYSSGKWDTRTIIMYARSHGYTPLTNFKHFCKINSHLLLDHCLPPDHSLKKNRKAFPEPDVYVDVDDSVSDSEKHPSCEPKVSMIYPSTKSVCSYIRGAALDQGVLLKNEELVPGVIFNGAEQMILQAVVCLAESLIRKSMASKVINGCYSENSIINVGDIEKAMKSRPEFKKYFL